MFDSAFYHFASRHPAYNQGKVKIETKIAIVANEIRNRQQSVLS